jgi:hypothetical protein
MLTPGVPSSSEIVASSAAAAPDAMSNARN